MASCKPLVASIFENRTTMKINLTIILLLLFFTVQGQKITDIYFERLISQGDYIHSTSYSEAAFCGPGEVIQEEITFYSNMTFLYLSLKETPKIVASGTYSLKNKHIFLDYDWIKLDSSANKSDSFNVNKIKLYKEFEIVKDKHWEDDGILRLLECGKNLGRFRSFLVYGKNFVHTRRIFLYRKKRLVLKQTTTYGMFTLNASP